MPIAPAILALVLAASIAVGSPPPVQEAPALPGEKVYLAPTPAELRCPNVVEMQAARSSDVTSAWLANGVRVHHLRLESRPGTVVATIALSGAKLLEDAKTRGVSEIAAGVLDDWDAAAPQASKAEQMEGRDVRIDAFASQDALMIRVAGSVADLEHGLRVVRSLLTEPVVTPQSVEQARERVTLELRRHEDGPHAVLDDAINSQVLPPGDPRLDPPDERSLRAIDEKLVRSWIERHARAGGAPIEAAIVGDLSLAEALHAVDGTLGGLPARPRVAPETYRQERRVPGPRGPVAKELRNAPGVNAGRAIVAAGCFGPDIAEVPDQRALRVGVRIVLNRLKQRLAPPDFTPLPDFPGGRVYVSAFDGLGMVLVHANVARGEAAHARAVMQEELGRLAREGPTAEELGAARTGQLKDVQMLEGDPRYWSSTLARSTGLGIDPDVIAGGPEFYRTVSGQAVREALAKYLRPDRLIALTLLGPDRPAPAPSK